jgi:hypothetical protein
MVYWPGHPIGQTSSGPERACQVAFWQVQGGHRELRGVRMEGIPILDAETGTPISPATLTVIYVTPTRAVRERLASTTLFIGVAAFALVIASGCFACCGAASAHRILAAHG